VAAAMSGRRRILFWVCYAAVCLLLLALNVWIRLR
jgi:hypothetical protein